MEEGGGSGWSVVGWVLGSLAALVTLWLAFGGWINRGARWLMGWAFRHGQAAADQPARPRVRPMAKFDRVRVAKQQHATKGKLRNDICCPWCHDAGRDSVCKVKPPPQAGTGEYEIKCDHPEHGRFFVTRLSYRDYQYAVMELEPPVG